MRFCWTTIHLTGTRVLFYRMEGPISGLPYVSMEITTDGKLKQIIQKTHSTASNEQIKLKGTIN